MQSFDELEWTKEFFDNAIDLKSEGLDRVKNFVFLWNIFENYACGKSASLDKISDIVEVLHSRERLSVDAFKEYVAYFHDRYFDPEGKSPYTVDCLRFRQNKNDQAAKVEVIAVLKGEKTDPADIVKALLYIIYQFRNNLFHGEKKVVHLHTQI